jgi:hypothetical protein
MKKLLVLTTLVLTLGTARAEDDGPADRSKLIAIAKRFVPADMREESDRNPEEMPLSVDATSGKLDGRHVYLVAAYGNEVDGRLRVFNMDTASPKVVAETKVLGMAGTHPHIDLQDVDGDSTPEVIVSFGGGRHDGVWVLKWNGTQLVSITPVEVSSGVTGTLLTDAVFEDLDGDGKLEAVTGADFGLELGNSSREGVMRSRTYKLTGGRFVRSSDLFFAERVFGGQSPLNDTFVLGRLDVQYRLRVINGDSSGTHAVKDGEIVINDATLMSKGDFDRGERIFTATFQPRHRTTFASTFAGQRATHFS